MCVEGDDLVFFVFFVAEWPHCCTLLNKKFVVDGVRRCLQELLALNVIHDQEVINLWTLSLCLTTGYLQWFRGTHPLFQGMFGPNQHTMYLFWFGAIIFTLQFS